MSYSHPRQFAFQRYEYASRDGYHDYYGLVLRENMAGFAAGTKFEAGSIRRDGAVHARSNGRIYFLGKHDNGKSGSYSASHQSSSSSNNHWSFSANTGAKSGSYSAPRQGYGSSNNRWSFSANAGAKSGSYSAPRQGYGSSNNRWSFNANGGGSCGVNSRSKQSAEIQVHEGEYDSDMGETGSYAGYADSSGSMQYLAAKRSKYACGSMRCGGAY